MVFIMDVTLKDIAKKTGVSISTVSRILNQSNSDTLNTTQKEILDMAKAMGYLEKKVNTLSKPQIASYKIGCIFTAEHESILSPFFSELHKGIQTEAIQLQPICTIHLSTISIDDTGFLNKLIESKFNGVIILGHTKIDTIKAIRDIVPHCTYAGLNSVPGMDNVISDVKQGIRAIVNHLYVTGRHKIGFIGPVKDDGTTYNEYRYESYINAMEKLGLEINKDFIQNSFLQAADGYEAAIRMIHSKNTPDAIVCGNDNVAIGVMKALSEKGIKIPENIALAGYDNIPDSAYLTPSLTTVDVPKGGIGRQALHILLDSIKNERDYHIMVELPFQLIVRESTSNKES